MNRKPDVNDFTGSVSVEGDVTPVTRQPINKINSQDWSKMTISELHQQREMLQLRYYRAKSVGVNTGTIEDGIKMIDAMLENMGGTEPTGLI